MIQAQFQPTFEGWRTAARNFLGEAIPPGEISWDQDCRDLFAQTSSFKPVSPFQGTVPAEFLALAETLAVARDPDRWALLYRILFRLQFENPNLLKISVDDDVNRARILGQGIRRDIHKMHAFVRFKKALVEGHEHYVAWHRPEHRIVRLATPFFARRFGDRRFSIFTPDESAHWDLTSLTIGPGMEQTDFQARDDWDELWKTYYRSIFNPARIKIKAMKMEMATKYWSSLPESSLIQELVREAPARLQKMAANHNRAAQVDPQNSLAELREKVQACSACPLRASATQAVFGQGAEHARLMIVGEQPGEQEDLSGVPFVGPAGKILNEALAQAGLDRAAVYLTNSVKHFKFTTRGKTRLHQKPSGLEVHACKPWLDAEIARIQPQVIVALGATAGTAILGRLPRISEERGQIFSNLKMAAAVLVTWHPAAILRSSGPEEANARTEQLVADLVLAAEQIKPR